MGYFSNGTEGEIYREKHCDHCVHDGHGENACAVWGLHLLHNYDQHKNEKLRQSLDMLIPRDKDDLGNGQCTMFIKELN